MYQIWPNQYATFLQEYEQHLAAIQLRPNEASVRSLVRHFWQLFSRFDLSLLTEVQQKEWQLLVDQIQECLESRGTKDATLLTHNKA